MHTNPATPNVTNSINQLQRFGFTGRFIGSEKPQEESQPTRHLDVVKLSESAKEMLARLQGKSEQELAAEESQAVEEALTADGSADRAAVSAATQRATGADPEFAGAQDEPKTRGKRFEQLLAKQPPGLMMKLNNAYGLRAQLAAGAFQSPMESSEVSQPINGEAPIAAEDDEPITAADIPPGTDQDDVASSQLTLTSTAISSYEQFAEPEARANFPVTVDQAV